MMDEKRLRKILNDALEDAGYCLTDAEIAAVAFIVTDYFSRFKTTEVDPDPVLVGSVMAAAGATLIREAIKEES